MTREELIARERAIKRRCRGPLKPGVRDVIDAKMLEAAKATTEEERQKLLREASDVDRAGRVRCGQDMNVVFLNGPLDGKEHEYTCPKCGVKGRYQAAGPVE